MSVRFLMAFWLAAAAPPPAAFLDATAGSGITFVADAGKTPAKFLLEAMGHGVAIFDADADGRPDIFFANGASLLAGTPEKTGPAFWNRLYRNQGNGTFADITERAGLRGRGYGQGAATGDCDNDGRPDLFVTAFPANMLYRNQGGGAFAEITAAAGVAGAGWSTSAGFFDFDRDGVLDLFVARYLDWDLKRNKRCGGEGPALQSYCHPNEFPPATHLLYRGLGGCRFADVSLSSGVTRFPGKGLGVAFQDFDQDGWPDIAVANDSFPQQIFRNQHDGTFAEVALALGAAFDEDGNVFAGMGIDAADYDNDGLPDLFINALANQGYALFRNQKGLLNHVSAASGLAPVTKLHSGWGARFLDFDNDGWKDLFVAQGHVMDNIELTQPGLHYRESPLLLRNTNGRFTDASPSAVPMAGRGAAFGDLNNDGALDVVVSTANGAPRLLRNTAANSWLLVDTIGGKSNRDGSGAAIRLVTPSGRQQFGYVSTAGSYLSANDKRVHFGLGAERSVKVLEIRWPSGVVQTWRDIPANQVFIARESAP